MAKTSVAIAVLLLLLPAAAAAKSDTHTVSVQGTLVNNWTLDEKEPCSKIGSGSVTVKFTTTRSYRTTPYIDKYQRNGKGAWVIGKLFGFRNSLIKGLGYMKVKGTITRVDNTTLRPPNPGEGPCAPNDKTGCGTFPIKRGIATFEQRDRKSVAGALSTQYLTSDEGCYGGVLDIWSSPPSTAGGTRDGNVVVKMPSASKMKRRGGVARGTSRKTTSFNERRAGTDTITRTFNATFKKR